MQTVTAAIGLGSNMPSPAGAPAQTLNGAVEAIRHLSGTGVIGVSSFHETAPVGPVAQPAYLNACVAIETSMSPRELLNHLLTIERCYGRDRVREQRWGPRTLDLDLILYGDRVINEPGLHIPHPRMHERLFVLEPLAEVLPHAMHPCLGRTVSDLLSAASGGATHPR